MSAVFALLASLTYGVADFMGGVVGRRVSTFSLVFWSQLVGLAFGVVASLLFPATAFEIRDLAWGAVAGTVGLVGILALYHGLAWGRMAVVSPLAGLISAVIPLGLGVALGERPQGLEWLGVAIALPAIWIVAAGAETEKGRGGVGMGLIAGVGFGLFFAALAQAGDGAGFWPLVASRTASVTLLAVVVAKRREPVPATGSRLVIYLVGIGEVLANVFLLLAYRSGLISLVSVLASLYPAITVLLAVSILKEPLARRQIIGVALALVAVALIAL
ncbi:MAG: DMT family transporter [Actinomycetota bacterium]|nr:DMT family transporter [Actinomycetota bacterium]